MVCLIGQIVFLFFGIFITFDIFARLKRGLEIQSSEEWAFAFFITGFVTFTWLI